MAKTQAKKSALRESQARRSGAKRDFWFSRGIRLSDVQRDQIGGVFERQKRFLVSTVNRFARASGVPEDVLYDAGLTGLMRAALKFDPNRDTKEITYVAAAIVRGVRQKVLKWPERHPKFVDSETLNLSIEQRLPLPLLIEREELDALRRIVPRLWIDRRFVLAHALGLLGPCLSSEQLAELLGVSVGVIKETQKRGIEDLQVLMSGRLVPEPKRSGKVVLKLQAKPALLFPLFHFDFV